MEKVSKKEDIMEGVFHDCHPSAPKAKRPGLLCLVPASTQSLYSAWPPPASSGTVLFTRQDQQPFFTRHAPPAAVAPLDQQAHGQLHHTQLCHFLQSLHGRENCVRHRVVPGVPWGIALLDNPSPSPTPAGKGLPTTSRTSLLCRL